MLVQYIIIGSILLFIIILILIFAFTGHLRDNPHGILIIFLIGVLLFSGYMILAYYKQWWPYSISPNNHNNIILYITLIVMVITALILAYVIYLAFKHHKERQNQMYIIHKTVSEPELAEPGLNDSNQNIVTEQPEEFESNIAREEFETDQNKNKEGLEREAIERLALEHQLQEEGGDLEKGSGIKIATREKILAEELEKKNISQDVAEEGVETAALKELEATGALRSELPSVQMFGEGGAEDLINGVRTIPSELKPEIKAEISRERIENQRRERGSDFSEERFQRSEQGSEGSEQTENQRRDQGSERSEQSMERRFELERIMDRRRERKREEARTKKENEVGTKEAEKSEESEGTEKGTEEGVAETEKGAEGMEEGEGTINGFESEAESAEPSEGGGLLSEIESKAESAGSEIESGAEEIAPELESGAEEAGEVAE